MAPKALKQAVPKCLILLVVILGLILPGSIARQYEARDAHLLVMLLFGSCPNSLPHREAEDCANDVSSALSDGHTEEPWCCMHFNFADDCICDTLKNFPDGAKALGKACNLTIANQKCKAIDDREEALSKLYPCDRFFERIVANEISKINRDDVKACGQAIRTCKASCSQEQ
ncbi:hypothetical protein ACP4OV_029496 [Aristida adscensionis]